MSRIRLLLATTNQGKIKEIKAHLADLPLRILSLKDLGSLVLYAEKGETFLENARGKSLFYSRGWDGLTLAEDSGIEIEHLGRAPGIHSARFSGPEGTDRDNNRKVLQLMQDVPEEKRKARFVSCMVLTNKGKVIKKIEESVEGLITFTKKGSHGFGYDPIFFYPPLKKTFAQLTSEEKNKVSHRGRALKRLREYLSEYLSSA